MKLVLANNQNQVFRDFHKNIQKDAPIYDYVAYQSLLFEFRGTPSNKVLSFIDVNTARRHSDYTGVYINGYLSTPEIAATVATVLDANDIPYVNRELSGAPSLSKLTMYAKLAQAGVQIPHTYAGAAYAIRRAQDYAAVTFPAILKRADADRGIDNYKVTSFEEVVELLADQDDRSLWILQAFIPNDGFYLVSVYDDVPAFGIYRTLEERPDGNARKAHMFKPKGGANATLIEVSDLSQSLIKTSVSAAKAMNRQIASVDSIYEKATDTTFVLEVNYNPQLVTIETLKKVRQEAFLNMMKTLGES